MFSGTEKSASGEPASGFENATGNGRSAQAGQSGCGKLEETADLDRMLQLLQSWALLHAFRDGKRNCLNYRNREKTKRFYRKRKNSRRNVRLLQLQKMSHFVFIMRITCGFWKRMVENSSGFRRLDRKKFQRKRMRFFWEEAIRNFVPGSSRKMSPCAIPSGRQLKWYAVRGRVRRVYVSA